MKVILFNNIITPTNTPLFNSLFEHFKKKNIEFKVIFTSSSESNRNYDTSKEEEKFLFKYIVLNEQKIRLHSNKDNHFFHFNLNISSILDKEKPDVIIHAWWAGISAWTSLWWCRKNNAKYILWSWSTKYENSWRRTITQPIVKYLIHHADGFLSYWTRASEYLVSLWAKKEQVQEMYNTVDIDYFVNQSILLQPRKNELKQKYGINTKYVLLFVGQLIKRKWIYSILDWFLEFQKSYPNISLIFAGNGEEEKNIKDIIEKQSLKNIFFPWFFQNNKISELYTIADIFTLPSEEEVWWLVINEAMCFWLPIITAYKVWASIDLVQEWKNGYIMKEDSAGEFTKWLQFIFDSNLIQKNNSLEIIKNFKINTIIRKLQFYLK